MPKYEIALVVADKSGLRKKEGDIVAIRSYPHNWGRKEIDAYLIVIIECNKTYEEMYFLVKKRLYENNLQEGIDFRRIEDEDIVGDYSYKVHAWDIKAEKIINKPAKIARNRYKIPLNLLGSINLTKVQDENYIYQPFKEASQLVQMFDGVESKYDIKPQDVDCASIGISSEDEVVIQWQSSVNLIQSNFDNTYVNP